MKLLLNFIKNRFLVLNIDILDKLFIITLFTYRFLWIHSPTLKGFQTFWSTFPHLVHFVKTVQIRKIFWSVFSCIQSKYRKIRTRKNCVFGHFSLSCSPSWFSEIRSVITSMLTVSLQETGTQYQCYRNNVDTKTEGTGKNGWNLGIHPCFHFAQAIFPWFLLSFYPTIFFWLFLPSIIWYFM